MKNQKENRRGILKLIIVPVDDMNKLRKKILKKRHFTKNTWYDWLINYVNESMRKQPVVLKTKL